MRTGRRNSHDRPDVDQPPNSAPVHELQLQVVSVPPPVAPCRCYSFAYVHAPLLSPELNSGRATTPEPLATPSQATCAPPQSMPKRGEWARPTCQYAKTVYGR